MTPNRMSKKKLDVGGQYSFEDLVACLVHVSESDPDITQLS